MGIEQNLEEHSKNSLHDEDNISAINPNHLNYLFVDN